jgi:uncharacterized protein YdhG (YjbR/CyaY superfamily)
VPARNVGSDQEVSMSPDKTAGATAKRKRSGGLSAEERAAMRETIRERRAALRGGNGEADVIAKIAEMQEPDRAMAQRVHTIVRATAPELSPRTWYGMPAYAKDGNVVCFFQNAQKFKSRYSTLGFSDTANLDDGAMWPVAFALKEMNAETEARVAELVKQAVS